MSTNFKKLVREKLEQQFIRGLNKGAYGVTGVIKKILDEGKVKADEPAVTLSKIEDFVDRSLKVTRQNEVTNSQGEVQ